jgi:hypothetical protein
LILALCAIFTELFSHVIQCVCLRLSCESFIQTRVVVFKQNFPFMISWTCI